MEKLTGVVLEREDNCIVMLTDTGEFRKIKVNGHLPDIGEEVCMPIRTRRRWVMPKFTWVAAVAAVMLFMLFSPLANQFFAPPETAVAWVTVDINPAIELTVSNRQNVMAAQAFNKEGEKILGLLDLKGQKVEKAVNEITAQAKELGYIARSKDNTVLISVAVKPSSGLDKVILQQTLLASAQDVLRDDALGGTVQTVNVTPELRDKAVARRITAGKYAVLIEAVTEYKLKLTEKDMQEKSVAKAIADAGGSVDEVLARAHEENEFDKNEKVYLQIASVPPAPVKESENVRVNTGPDQEDKKPSENHRRYVSTIRDGKDPEGVTDNTYKDNTNNNASPDQQPADRQPVDQQPTTAPVDPTKPPALPEQGESQPPGTDRGGLQQGTGNYLITNEPLDDGGMHILKPNF